MQARVIMTNDREPSRVGPADRRGQSLRATAWMIMLAVVSMTPLTATAQNDAGPDPFSGVEEMIVVGGTSAALLAPQSTSAIAFDSAELDSYGVEDLSDVSAYVPNLEIRSQNATNASFFVRGVGLQDFGSNASSAVPIYQDGVARNPSATQLVGLYDVGGLTVLRGPQGSGAFRNASAGAILIESVKPEPDFSGFSQVSLSQLVSHDAHDAPRYNFDAAMNAPIYKDIVSARISMRYKQEKPFVENGCANRSPIEEFDDNGDPILDDDGNPINPRPAPRFKNDPEAQLCDTLVDPDTGGGNGETLLGPINIPGGNVLEDRSDVRPFLSKKLGEVDDWGIRGQLRIQPPDTGVDWIFRFEATNLNRDSTLGQVIGTSGSLLGVPDGAGYRDADITRRENYLTLPKSKGGEGRSLNEARSIISRELRRDPLDKGPYRGDFDSPGRTLLETYTFSTTGDIDLDTFDIETNFGYIDYRKSERRDTDLTPNIRFPSNGNDQAWEIFGDLQFSGDQIGNTVIDWDIGATTLIQKVEASQVQFIGDVIADNGFTERIYSYGIYASFRYEFLEAFTFAAGARYNWEKKNFRVKDRRTRFNPFTGQPITFPPRRSSNQLTWDDMTGFAEIRYDFTEDISSYMKYSRGFKAGHFNPSVPDKAEVPGEGFADPEKIDSFEWGLSVNAWASRVRAEGAFFFYNYENYQVFRLTTTPEGVFRVIRNAKRARNYGAELDVTISPLEGFVPEAVEGLRITLRGGWLETEFLDYVEEDVRIFGAFPATVQIDNSGNPLLNAPTLQASGTITWELISQQLGTFIPQYDFTWTDDVPFDPNKGRGQIDGFGDSKFQPYLIGNLSYLLHNVRLTWRPPGDPGLQLSGWCRNLTDERYSTFAVDISNFAQSQLHYVADPRSCGADIRFTW